MTEKTAAGQKTEPKADPFEAVLIAGIAKGIAGMESALIHADRLTDVVLSDPNGRHYDSTMLVHQRSSEQQSIVMYMKAMAEITLAAAKLRGEFNHTYDVTRRQEGTRPESSPKKGLPAEAPAGEGVAKS